MTTSQPSAITRDAPQTSVPRRRWQLRHGVGFWVIATAFTAVMAFSTVPTPLYALYQQRDGFPTFVVTLIFAAYAIGVVASLYLAGHVSDWLGRRRIILLAILVQIVSAAVFLAWPEVPGLIVARLLCGIGVGILTATATAHLSELGAVAKPGDGGGRSGTVAGVANIGGLALGPLIGGLFAEFVPRPLVTPYLAFLVLLTLAAIAVACVPETVERRETRPAYRPQRISLPAASRPAFAAAGAAAFAAFAIFGLFTSLAPSFLVTAFGVTDHLVAGAVAFSVFAAASAAQVIFARLPRRSLLTLAVVLMPIGLIGIAAGAVTSVLPAFIAGGVIAGAGVGLLFRGATATAASLASPETRGEVMAALFLIAYAGLSIPVLLIGLALAFVPALTVLVVFSALVGVAVLWSGVRMIRRG